MKRLYLITMFAQLFLTYPALAATDYVCLKACSHNNGNTASCIPKCSYSTSPADAVSPQQPNPQYRCFNTCLHDGVEPSACIVKCAPATPEPQKSASAKAYNANPLDKLQMSNELMLPPKISHAPKKEIDRACTNLCLKGHLQYQLCAKNCTK